MAEEARVDYTPLIEGLSKLKTGALLALIALILSIGGFLLSPGLFSLLGAMGGGLPPEAVIGSLLIGLGVSLFGGILAIIAFFIWFSATGSLKRFDPSRLGIGRTGMLLQLIGAILVILGLLVIVGGIASVGAAAATTPSPETLIMGTVLGGLGLVGLGGVLALIGLILFGIMLTRLAEIEGVDPGFKTAGILYILTLVPYIGGILGLVAIIMIYVYSKRSIETLSQRI